MQEKSTQKPEPVQDSPVFQIKHRFSGKVFFEFRCTSFKICVEAAVKSGFSLSGADLSRADLSGAYLSGAYLSGADLSGADLSGADLSGAYLYGAYLYGADLSRADLSGAYLSRATINGVDGKKNTIKYIPLQISGLPWHVIVFDKDMKIGCEYHSISDWWSFDDDRISEMDRGALVFWTENKQMLQSLCAANGRG